MVIITVPPMVDFVSFAAQWLILFLLLPMELS
jgi:hypothetical protein